MPLFRVHRRCSLPATTFIAPASGKAQLSVLKNGIKVATVDNNGGVRWSSPLFGAVSAALRHHLRNGTVFWIAGIHCYIQGERWQPLRAGYALLSLSSACAHQCVTSP